MDIRVPKVWFTKHGYQLNFCCLLIFNLCYLASIKIIASVDCEASA